MKDHVPFRDYDMTVSPHIRSFIETQLDRSGFDPSTPFGFAAIHHILRTNKEATIKSNAEWSPNLNDEETQKSGRIRVSPPTADITSGLRMGNSHPVITQILRKRLIEHGDRITDPNQLHKHLSALASSFKDYRARLEPSLSDLESVDEEHRYHINPIPQREQLHISSQIKKLMTHPEFNDANPNEQLTPTAMRNVLSVQHNLETSESSSSSRTTLHHLFSHILLDPHVRHDFHNFLDSYENRGAVHKQLSAAIRGHMIKSQHMNGEERIRMLKKFANDTSSIDVGDVGMYHVPTNGTHPLTGMRHRNDPAIEQFKNTDRALWGKSFWNIAPAFNDNKHKTVQRLLLKDIARAKFKKQELIDMFGHAHHLLTTHPTFTENQGAIRNIDQFGRIQAPTEIFSHHVDQLHRAISTNRNILPISTAQQLILARSKMIAAGVTK